jgi:peptide/nickel transport system substrate-binding protein
MVINRRLFIWLIRAYIKKWGRIILLSFLGGLFGFFFLIFFSKHIAHLFPQRERIGMVGAYTLDDLPTSITQELSRGLTKVSPKDEIQPDLASSWEIKDNGKTYIFHLKKGIHFSNGKEVTSNTLGYSFKDATIEKPDNYTIVFKLKDQYAPFLVTVSRPIFPKGLQGLGEYTISNIKINGDFISSLNLTATRNKQVQQMYIFYPNQESLKTAYLLGEVTKISGINSPVVDGTNLSDHRNTVTNKSTNYDQLVAIFYNTKDEVVSDNKLRKGLTYALPDNFLEGERAYVPYSPQSIYFSKDAASKSQDLAHAKLLIDAAYGAASSSAKQTITLKTLTRYHDVASRIVKIWQSLGVKVKIEDVDSKPSNFQMYLGDFFVPKDPDQYELWHSKSDHNITRFDSKRIDKLLEDGRRTVNVSERIKIYDEFQKYLLDDAVIDTPASFLYFPYSYTLTRR